MSDRRMWDDDFEMLLVVLVIFALIFGIKGCQYANLRLRGMEQRMEAKP